MFFASSLSSLHYFLKQNASMAKRKFKELDKITFVGGVDEALNQSLTKKNIKGRFKGIVIWLFNPKPMENGTQPIHICT
jgi:hypothetical protein